MFRFGFSVLKIGIALAFALELPTFAATYELFLKTSDFSAIVTGKHSRPVKNYDTIVENLRAGDTVVFSSGEAFHIDAVISARGINRILLTGDRVLRIANSRANLSTIKTYSETHAILKNLGVPVIRLFLDESNPDEFLVSEKVTIITDLSPWAPQWSVKKPSEFPEADATLPDFARLTAPLEFVEDQRYDQIVYTVERGWIFLDFLKHVWITKTPHGPSIFTLPDRAVSTHQNHPMDLSLRLNDEATARILPAIMNARCGQTYNSQK